MRIKLFTFRYSATLGGFDETPLVNFIRDKELVAFREHFYLVNEVPHLSCILHYQDRIVSPAVLELARQAAATPTQEPNLPAPRKLEKVRTPGVPVVCAGFDESQRALFNHLREWRYATAQEEGIDAFLVFTNRQLAAIVQSKPDSPTALMNIEGIGPGKVKKYGAEVLRCVHGTAVVSTEGAGAVPVEQEVSA